MIKNLQILFFVFFFFGSVKAQDYSPFPEDSLFFETSNADDVLMPLVKNNDLEDLIQKVNTIPAWDMLSSSGGLEWENYDAILKLPVYSWLGKCFQEAEKIYFISAQGDSIYIDTSIALGESYPIPLQEHYIDMGEVKYLNVFFYDFFETETGDSIKEYRFTFLDQLMAPVSFNYNNQVSVDHYWDEHVLHLSKNNGIVKAPAFYYFPYGKQYIRKAKINSILDFSTPYAYQVFYKNVGNEIHTEEFNGDFFGNNDRVLEKKVCVAQDYNPVNEAFYTTYDVWTRKEDATNQYEFIQRKDTVYLNDYHNLNKTIPNGFTLFGFGQEGFFYEENTKAFVEDSVDQSGYYQLVNDSIYYTNPVGSTSVLYKNYYRIDLGGLYYEYEHHNGFGHKKIIYYNVNGEEWGEAYTNAFLLDVEESSIKPLSLSYENNNIQLQLSRPMESARIYDTNGRFIRYITSLELQEEISIRDLNAGIYILVVWDGKQAHTLKFVK